MTDEVRLPPQNIDAERAVLGAMLTDPAAATLVLGATEEGDYLPDPHRAIFRAARRVMEAGRGIDVQTVAAELREHPHDLEMVGGVAPLAYLMEFAAAASIAAHLLDYVQLIRRAGAQREQIALLSRELEAAWEGRDPLKTATDVGEGLARLAERVEAGPVLRRFGPQPLREVLDQVLLAMGQPEQDFVPSPIPELNDRLGGGIMRSELVDLGGRPGVAKSALALQWSVLAAEHGHRTLVISREMTNAALGRRVLSQQARVAALAMRRRDIDEHERRRILRALPRLGALPLYFDDVTTTIGRIRQLVRAGGYRFVVVDYLQLVRSPGFKDRRLEVAAVSAGLKELTKRYSCSVLALSSLTRLPRDRGKRAMPDMDNLKESGDLEHDADVVLLLHQPDPDSSDRELIFAKLREGAAGGSVSLSFQGQYVSFDQLPSDRPDDDDVPF